jgi:hypothetical protein
MRFKNPKRYEIEDAWAARNGHPFAKFEVKRQAYYKNIRK